MSILEKAGAEKAAFLSEWEAKQLLAEFGIPVTADRLALAPDDYLTGANARRFPRHNPEKTLTGLPFCGATAMAGHAFALLGDPKSTLPLPCGRRCVP